MNQNGIFIVKDFHSALSHFIGFICSLILMPVLLIRASLKGGDFITLLSCSIFMLSMALLYGASASYHSFNISKKVNDILKRIDHMSIFVLIAGSYTPVCLLALKENKGYILLTVIWILALLGIIFKLFFVHCPKYISSIMYISMGWAAISVFPNLFNSLTNLQFIFLVIGGILYTIGGVIYSFKFDIYKGKNTFNNHDLFHIFILLGSLFHYLMIFILV